MNDDRKRMIQQAFDTVATGYDHPSLPFFPETARNLLALIQPGAGKKILDVCCGTGAVALQAAEKFPASHITGIDLSSGMLQQAQRKASERNLKNTEFVQMDLDHLSFPDAHFDIATCSFGLFFLPDMLVALNNIKRVIKPGGSIVISSFVDGAFEPFSDIFLQRYQSFGKEVPPLSWKRLSNETLITDLFRSAGMNTVVFKHVPLGHAIKTAQQWWDVVWNAGYRGLLNQLTEQQRVEFETQHRQEISEYCADGNARLNTGVIIANAIKP